MSASASDRLVGIWAKIERAKHHVRQLEQALKAFRDTKPYCLTCNQTANSAEYSFRIRIVAPIPIDFALIVGEVFNHLRSALDHLAWQLIEVTGSKPSDHLYFPICKGRPEYEARLQGEIKGIGPDAVDVLNAIKPYKGGNDALWILHKLNNIDKHQVLLVLAYGMKPAFSVSYRNPMFESLLQNPDFLALFTEEDRNRVGRTVMDASFDEPNSLFWILKDDDEIVRISWPDGPPMDVNSEIDFSYDIALWQTEFPDPNPIIPFLNQLVGAVDEVVNLFVRFLQSNHGGTA
jgi:hypothetical protein